MDRTPAALALAQYANAIKNPNEFLKFIICEEDTTKWFILMHGFSGAKDEFVGGEYLVRIHLPPNFPFEPPQFYFMTPQGLYGLETKVCVSIGEYHKDEYRGVLGVDGFCSQLVSGLIGWKDMGGGIQIIKTTAREKRMLAMNSKQYNRQHHPELIASIESNFENYSKLWKKEPVVTMSKADEARARIAARKAAAAAAAKSATSTSNTAGATNDAAAPINTKDAPDGQPKY